MEYRGLLYARCRASAVPYDYWCMGKEEGSTGRTGDRQEYQIPASRTGIFTVLYYRYGPNINFVRIRKGPEPNLDLEGGPGFSNTFYTALVGHCRYGSKILGA